MKGKASGFALQIFEVAEKQGWPKWKDVPVEGGITTGLKYLVEERFDYFKHSEVVLAKLEAYYQKDEEIEEYLTDFQNLQSKAKVNKWFAKRLLLKNVREEIVEASVIQLRDLQYDELVNDLQRIGKASRICSLLDGEHKETSQELRSGYDKSCSVSGESGQIHCIHNAALEEQSPPLAEVLAKAVSAIAPR